MKKNMNRIYLIWLKRCKYMDICTGKNGNLYIKILIEVFSVLQFLHFKNEDNDKAYFTGF